MATRPTCDECHHPLTFHGGKALKLSAHVYQTRQKKCRALGCECLCFEGVDPGLPEWTYLGLDVDYTAKRWKLSSATVRKNAPKYGGVKVDGVWLFPPESP